MTCRKNYCGTCFQQLTTYIIIQEKRKKYLRSSHVDGKSEIGCFHVETATGGRQTRKMAGKSWSRGHFLKTAPLESDLPTKSQSNPL